MSDEKGDSSNEPAQPEQEPTPPATPEATAATEQPAAESATEAEPSENLSGLMASSEQQAKEAPESKDRPDLEAEALRAAESALAEGERALAAAKEQLQQSSSPQTATRSSGSPSREFLLRMLLAFNVLAMVIVALLPQPDGGSAPDVKEQGAHGDVAHSSGQGAVTSRYNEPWNKALEAADRRDFASAVAILENYLSDSPRMAPSQRLSVLMALSHYAARNGDIGKASEYQRKADAIDRSHSLPEDLVAMAKAAAESGDQQALRRVWARFLLQQRQIPSWLYKHVAEAYLQLGDSYRLQADQAAERARLQELEAAASRLRGEVPQRGQPR